MSQNKYRLPALDPKDADIVGILQRADPTAPTQDRPLALIMHGQLAHKDQSYHRRLAKSLVEERNLDSFRYDLRGQGGETEGEWFMGDYNKDADDLEAVISFLQTEFGYRIHIIIAHSRGSAIASYYLSCRQHHIPYFVNVSGRYDMTRVYQIKKYMDAIADHGYFEWKVKIGGKIMVAKITPESLDQFATWDNSYLIRSFPSEVHVLTVHGDADEAVPVDDAYLFEKIYNLRKGGSGTHRLSIVPGESHNYTRPFDEPVTSIMNWIADMEGAAPRPSNRKSKI